MVLVMECLLIITGTLKYGLIIMGWLISESPQISTIQSDFSFNADGFTLGVTSVGGYSQGPVLRQIISAPGPEAVVMAWRPTLFEKKRDKGRGNFRRWLLPLSRTFRIVISQNEAHPTIADL